MKKIIQFLIFIITSFTFAQDGTIDYSFNPTYGANNTINSTSIQADGKIIIGGNFTEINNTVCNKICRLNIDGTLDNSFNFGTGFNNSVNSICIQTDGKIVVVGNFTLYNGNSTNRIVRLNIDGTIDSTFNTGYGSGNVIYTAVLQSDDKIILGGEFLSFNGISKKRVVRLNSDGSIDSTFNSTNGPNDTVYSCALQSDGKILIGGRFTTFNSVTAKRFVRLNTNGTIDTSFDTSNGFDNSIRTISIQSDGKILIGGDFTIYNSISANCIIRLNANSTLDTTFNYGAGFGIYSSVSAINIQQNGKILIGGSFFDYNGVSCSNIIRLNIDGTKDSYFNASPDSYVKTISIQTNGNILIGGNFINCSNKLCKKIASVTTDGYSDDSFFPFTQDGSGLLSSHVVHSSAIQPNGKIIIAGSMNSYNTIATDKIIRLDNDGKLDTSFNTNFNNTSINGSRIWKIKILPDNKILIAGSFTSINGITRNGIAKLNSDGSLDSTFNPSDLYINTRILDFDIQSDGKIIIVGDGLHIVGNILRPVKRLNPDGSLDSSFNPDATTVMTGNLHSVAVQSNGKIIIGGSFLPQNGGGMTSFYLNRLNSNGTLDTTFNTGSGPNYFVDKIEVLADGKILICGLFSAYNNIPKQGILRLNPDGSVDNSLNYFGTGTSTTSVNTFISLPDGKIIISGNYTSYNGIPCVGIARINNDGSLDNTFVYGGGFDIAPSNMSLQSDGKIIIGGEFSFLNNNIQKNNIARLNNTTSILDVSSYINPFSFNIFPNPTNNYIHFNIPKELNVLSFEIYDLIGKKVDSNILNANMIDVNNYTSGLYFLHLKTDKGVLMTKFIKN